MKLLTLNLRGWQEQFSETKFKKIADYVNENDIDVIFFQETNQSMIVQNCALIINYFIGKGFYFETTQTHDSFGGSDEGLAILSKFPIDSSFTKVISKTKDKSIWQRRKMLSVCIDNVEYCCVHTTWDAFPELEPFEYQIDQISSYLENKQFFIAGDFNIDPVVDPRCYGYIKDKLGVYDISENIGYTYPSYDTEGEDNSRIKIDYIFTNMKLKKYSAQRVFDKEIVSDHFGVMVEVEF